MAAQESAGAGRKSPSPDLPPDGNSEHVQRPRRRRLRTVLLAVATAAALAVGCGWLWSYLDTVRRGNPFERAAKMGIPLSLSDPYFARWDTDRPTSPAENAAVIYEKAFALLPPGPGGAEAAGLPIVGGAILQEDPREPLPPEMLSTVGEYLAPHDELFLLLHRAGAVRDCRFPYKFDGFCTLLPHLSKERSAARLITLKVCLAVEQDRVEDAVTAVFDALALGRASADEPFLICALVGTNIDSLALNPAIDRLLSRTDPGGEQLLALQSALRMAAEKLSFRDAFIGELACVMDWFDALKKGRQLPGAPWNLPWVTVLLSRATGYVQANQRKVLRELLDIIDIAGNPTPERVNDVYWGRWETAVSSRRHALAALILPALSRGIRACERSRARLRAAAACCAALRYRDDKGKWPDNLESLVPLYLDKAPLDPFTRKPLIYKVDENGIAVYSVGPNQTDEQGRPSLVVRPPDADQSEWEKYDDVGFKVWK